MTDPRIEEQVAALMRNADDYANARALSKVLRTIEAAGQEGVARASVESALRAALVAERERALEDAAQAAEKSQPPFGFDWNLGRVAIYRGAKIHAADAIRALRERP